MEKMTRRHALMDVLKRDLLPIGSPKAQSNLRRVRSEMKRFLKVRPLIAFLSPDPTSHNYGVERGTPADRYYLRQFIEKNAFRVRGSVLEIERDEWLHVALSNHLPSITSREFLDINPANAEATLIADLCDDDPFGFQRFDCEIVLQTLQYLADPMKALQNLFHALEPGGALLLSVPTIARLDSMCGPEGDLWRFTPAGLTHLLQSALPGVTATVEGYGALRTAVGFLYGLTAEEMPRAYSRDDPLYPLVATAVVQKAVE